MERYTRQFASFLMLFFGRLDTEKGWTKQLHLGALRNVNTACVSASWEPDTGYDAVGDFPQGRTSLRSISILLAAGEPPYLR